MPDQTRRPAPFYIGAEPEIRLNRRLGGKITLTVLRPNAFNPSPKIVEPPNTRHVMGIMTDSAYDGESCRVRPMSVKRVKRNQKR